MKNPRIKQLTILLLLTVTAGLLTGIDQYVHLLVCHHELYDEAHHTENRPTWHSDFERHDCSVCQFFTCGQHQSLPCDSSSAEAYTNSCFYKIPKSNPVFPTQSDFSKITRAPPAV